MGAAPKQTEQSDPKPLFMKTVSYSNAKETLRVPLILQRVQKSKCESFDLVLLLLSFPSSLTQKLYGVYKSSVHQMTALLSEIFLLLVRAACEL